VDWINLALSFFPENSGDVGLPIVRFTRMCSGNYLNSIIDILLLRAM
jgi:hypothetical protein